MEQHRASSALTRRAAIGRLGLGVAAGAGLAATAAPVGASAAEPPRRADPNRDRPAPPPSGSSAGGGAARLAATTTPGTTYRSTAYGAFHTYGGTAAITALVGSGVWSSDTLLADIDLPAGALVTELTVWGGAGVSLELLRADLGTYTWATLAQVGAPAGTGTTTATTTLSAPVAVDPGQHGYLLAVYGSSATAWITSARVGYRAAGPFHAITPTRAYDTRLGTTAAPISSGTSRTLLVADALGGAADVVPAGATAVSYNLTATATTGGGYVTLVPFGSTSTASTLNWYAKGQTVANGGIVALGGDRQLTLTAGGAGTAHIALDITGYFL